jgi:CBS-domain-containing membrane protein
MDIRDWLSETTASDIMVRDVITFDRDQTLAAAADLLLREQITGAPVVDADGTCVGVLSVSDVTGAEEKVADERRKVAESSLFHSHLALPASVYAAKLAEVRDKIAPAAEQPVERFMTSDLVSVREVTPLETVVQRMVDAHVHRVVVLDADHRLKGIVSTTDVLAALLRASRTAKKCVSSPIPGDF